MYTPLVSLGSVRLHWNALYKQSVKSTHLKLYDELPYENLGTDVHKPKIHLGKIELGENQKCTTVHA